VQIRTNLPKTRHQVNQYDTGLENPNSALLTSLARPGHLSRETVKWLKIWLDHAKISEGRIFRRLIGRDEIGDALHPGSIARIFKRVAQWIGMPARFVAEVSGHSTRVGAAQDLAELDIDLAAITQAGGWKSTRMPLQYAEKINAVRSGMARAAAANGRDDADQMYK
jgi:integrase